MANLKIIPFKCALFNTLNTYYVGHVVSRSGVLTDPNKCAAVPSWPAPLNVSKVRSFLGHVGCYRQFIPNFATVTKLLTRLTHKCV